MLFLYKKYKQSRQNKIFLVFLLIFVLLTFYNILSSIKYLQLDKYNNLGKIGTEYFIFDEADTPGTQELGLSFRERMCNRCGMIFEFKESGNFAFWMKDMRYDLDMIYVDEHKKVVEILRGFKKESYPAVYQNENPSKYVIELNSGAVDGYGIKIGDVLDY
jgi:hypothetical protein